jgi:class 3 adenylate cyclase
VRITFRAKILVALILAIASVLGAALWTVDRAYARQIDDRVKDRADRGAATFHEVAKEFRRQLITDAEVIADLSRLKGEFVEDPKKAADIAAYEIDLRRITTELLVLASRQGQVLSRRARRPDGNLLDVAAPETPEREFVERALRDGTNDGFLTLEGRLYLVVAAPSIEGDAVRCVVLLGRAITGDVAKRIRSVLAEHAGYAADGRIVACSLDGAAGEIGDLRARPERFTAAVAGRTYRVVQVAPMRGVLFVSLDSLLEERRDMRFQILMTGLAGLGIALILGVVISRGVTAPVRDLVDGTGRVAKGDYAHAIAVRSRDELGDLAAAFNRMAGDLATKEKMRAVLNKVVAPEVAEELLKGDLALGGTLVRATLLFADLRGFTAMTQGVPPQQVVAMLNEFMTAMTDEVLACKGIVDKYVGDEIIALFGVPRALGHDALAAVEAAHRMRVRLAELNGTRAARGEPPLAMGIGVHTGEVVAGRMGSAQQLNYTCIGEAMNLASRLCSNAKAGQILVSQATLDDAGASVEAKPLAPIPVKGFSEPVAVFEVVRVEKGATSMRRKS